MDPARVQERGNRLHSGEAWPACLGAAAVAGVPALAPQASLAQHRSHNDMLMELLRVSQ